MDLVNSTRHIRFLNSSKRTVNLVLEPLGEEHVVKPGGFLKLLITNLGSPEGAELLDIDAGDNKVSIHEGRSVSIRLASER